MTDLISTTAENVESIQDIEFFFQAILILLIIGLGYYFIYSLLQPQMKKDRCKLHRWVREDNMNGGTFLYCSRCHFTPELEELTNFKD